MPMFLGRSYNVVDLTYNVVDLFYSVSFDFYKYNLNIVELISKVSQLKFTKRKSLPAFTQTQQILRKKIHAGRE